jgi:branched-chain amino acid aminotransferase
MIVVSVDGELVPPDRAVISVFDRGFLYGDGLFEVFRTWSRRAPDLDAHLGRLRASARQLVLPVPDGLEAWTRAAIAAADAIDRRVRVVVTRGAGPIGARLATLPPGRAIVIVEPLPVQSTELALAVVDLPLPRRSGPGHKSLSYLDAVIARELAASVGADEALRLDESGDAVEGATCNVFAVTGGVVTTSHVDSGVLPGITRGRVLELCRELDIPSGVRRLPLRELREADEVFVTSALRGVVSVTRLDGVRRVAGEVTRRIAQAYAHLMAPLL